MDDRVRCEVCGRPLREVRSRLARVGPVCARTAYPTAPARPAPRQRGPDLLDALEDLGDPE